MIIVVLATSLIWWNPVDLVSFLALAVVGFCVSPVFPVATSMTPGRVGAKHAANAIGYQMAVARLGLSLVPGLVGNLANVFGLEIIPPLLFINATFMLLLQETISRKQVPLHKS